MKTAETLKQEHIERHRFAMNGRLANIVEFEPPCCKEPLVFQDYEYKWCEGCGRVEVVS